MIAAGNNGVANEASILSATSRDKLEESLSWMVKNEVNVLNTSFSYLGNVSGTYSSNSKIADQFIKNYLYTHISSAGNYDKDLNPYNKLGSPSTGFNVICVGNTSESNEIVYKSSSYVKNNDYYASKPNIVAPGSIVTNAYSKKGQNGTSFSTPLVSGCVALLMEEFPTIMAHPELSIAVLTASSSPMSSIYNNRTATSYYEESGLHSLIGAGCLNYQKMREGAKQSLIINRPRKATLGVVPQYLDIIATNKQRIRASSAWLRDYDSLTDYDLELYKVDLDNKMEKVAFIENSYNNVEFIDFDVKTPGKYRLAINQKSKNLHKENVALSFTLIEKGDNSISGASNIDNTLSKHFKIDPDTYKQYGSTYNNEVEEKFEAYDGIHCYNTSRLRTRFTDDEKLVLSAKSNDANCAFIEFNFDTTKSINDDWGLYNVQYDFGLWSDNESLIKQSTINLYGFKNETRYLIRDFYAPKMSNDPNKLTTYLDCVDKPVNGLRFIVNTNYTNNKNNRGRVVIGNIEGDIHYHHYLN